MQLNYKIKQKWLASMQQMLNRPGVKLIDYQTNED